MEEYRNLDKAAVLNRAGRTVSAGSACYITRAYNPLTDLGRHKGWHYILVSVTSV